LSQIASFVVLVLFPLPLPFFAVAFLIPSVPADDCPIKAFKAAVQLAALRAEYVWGCLSVLCPDLKGEAKMELPPRQTSEKAIFQQLRAAARSGDAI